MLYEKDMKVTCPFCGSGNVSEYVTGTWLCNDCQFYFDINDIVIEPIRHKLSALLSGEYATEENPMPCEIEIGESEVESFGFHSNELPRITSIFETQDGVIYFNIEGHSEPIEFDSLCIEDLEIVADALELK